MMSERRLPVPGEVFAGHRIESELGRGGMGVVFRATDLSLGRERALKIIDPELSDDDVFVARFRREAKLAASIDHAGVVPVHGAGEEEGLLYLSTTLIEGEDLERVLADGPLPPERTVEIVEVVASALAAAHQRGLVHRDVKPANVLIGSGADHPVFLTDFGISKPLAREDEAATAVTRGGDFLGTADYVSPEQIEGREVDERTDVYALACLAFHALTGRPPYPRETELATLVAHAKAERPSATALVPSLPSGVDAVLAEGMAIDPGSRFPSPVDFAVALEDAIHGSEPPRRQRPGRRGLLIGAGLLLVLAAVVLAVVVAGGDEEEPAPMPARSAGSPAAELLSASDLTTRSVGAGPLGLAIDGERLYVAGRDADAVDVLDAGSLRPEGRAIATPAPIAVAAGFGSIWAISSKALYRLDPEGSEAPIEISAGVRPSAVAVGEGSVWVADEKGDAVVRVDPDSNSADPGIPVPGEPRALVLDGDTVWVACAGDGSVAAIDAGSMRVEGRAVEVGGRPTAVAAGFGSIWAVDNERARLLQIDPASHAVLGEPIETDPKPRGVAAGLGSVWVVSGQAGTLSRIDPQEGSLIGEPLGVGTDPADVAISDAVFTANFGSGSVSRVQP